jgi:hypothetical protein
MQFQRDGAKIVKTLTGRNLKYGDHLVIIPKAICLHGWGNIPDAPACYTGNEAIHIQVLSTWDIDYDEDYPPTETFDPHPDDPFDYNIMGNLLNSIYSPEGEMLDCWVWLNVEYDEATAAWEFKLTVSSKKYNSERREIDFVVPDGAIHDIVNYRGAKALPDLGRKVAERTYRVEKAAFRSVLARRFGDVLADDITRSSYPEPDAGAPGESLINRCVKQLREMAV